MDPARSIIARLGGEAVVSSITGTAYTAPYRWQHPKAKGGTDGQIPQRHYPALLAYAQEKGIPLSPAEFLPTASLALSPSEKIISEPESRVTEIQSERVS